jgi:hypothetical protein
MWWIGEGDGEWNGERDNSEKLSGGRVLIFEKFEWIFVWSLKVNLRLLAAAAVRANLKGLWLFEFWNLNFRATKLL